MLTPRSLTILFILLNKPEPVLDNFKDECIRVAKDHQVNGVVSDAITLNACTDYVIKLLKQKKIAQLHKVQRPGFYNAFVSFLLLKNDKTNRSGQNHLNTVSQILNKGGVFQQVKRRGKEEDGTRREPLTYEL